MKPQADPSTFDARTVAQLDATWGDPERWTEHGLQWTHLPEVKAAIAQAVSGDASVAPLQWFFQQVALERALPLPRVLVLACGGGRVEREAVAQGWAHRAVALDLSAKVLSHARAAAQAQGLAIEYHQASMNQLPLGQGPFQAGSFDAVLGVAAVHHCRDLERLYADLATLLVPGGWLFLDEYIGPDRFQWPDAQMRHLNRLLDLLPPRLRTTLDGRLKAHARRPTPQEVVAVDESEAVRSADILPLLPRHFEVCALRPYPGTLLHLLLSDVAQNFMGEAEAPYLSALMAAEDELMRAGELEPNFAAVTARRPR